MLKKLINLSLATLVICQLGVSAYAIDLYGENDDTIIGETYCVDVNSPRIQSRSHECPNYYESVESLYFFYDGYIQFKPSHKTTSSCGHKLKSGLNVKQAWIDYRRGNESVIGGAVYTTKATSKYSNEIHSASAKATDHLIPGEDFTTNFYLGWNYFA